MSSQNAFKKRRERTLVLKFLDYLAIPYKRSGIRSVREGQKPSGKIVTGPDVKITCSPKGKSIRVGIEVAEYQVDADATTGSQGRQFLEFFDKIWSYLQPLLSNNKSLHQYSGVLFFDRNQTPRPKDAQKIAEKIIHLLKSNVCVLVNGKRHYFHRTREPKHKGDLDKCDILKKYFTKIVVKSSIHARGPFCWKYNIAACVGLVEEIVLRLINSKKGKISSYDRSKIEEMWLLICAGAKIPQDSAGSRDRAFHKLTSRYISDAAKNTGFDRVIFWSVRGWHIDLK